MQAHLSFLLIEGYDGGSSDSECESPTLDEQEGQSPLMPEFWLIVKIHQDRVKVYSHSRSDLPRKTPPQHSSVPQVATGSCGGRRLLLGLHLVPSYKVRWCLICL